MTAPEWASIPTTDIHVLHRLALHHALKACAGNRTHAAVALNISLRTLRNWLHRYKIRADDYKVMRTAAQNA